MNVKIYRDGRSLSVDELLSEAERDRVVFLTRGGQTRFAVVAADEEDMEALALGSTPEFMAYLEGLMERARSRPGRSLEEIRAELELLDAETPSLDDVLDRLEPHRQRATYAAVAGIIGGLPRFVTVNRPRDRGTRGWSTGRPGCRPATSRARSIPSCTPTPTSSPTRTSCGPGSKRMREGGLLDAGRVPVGQQGVRRLTNG